MTAEQIARDEATAWYARLQSNAATEQDWLAFEAWMATPANADAYEAVEAIMGAIDGQHDAMASVVGRSADTPRRQAPIAWWGAGIAVAAAAVVAGLMIIPAQVREISYAAPAQTPRTVTLADNTMVELNRGAVLRARIGQRVREVVLEKGEASFVVTHDATRPFAVTAGEATITDVGTEFDVVRTPRYVTVTVRDGEVALRARAERDARLIAGQQARLENGQLTIATTNPNDAFGWQSGRLIYRDAPLTRIVDDLNRYSDQPVSIGDTRAENLRFSGVLVVDVPAIMVRQLEAFLPIQSAQNADGIVLRSRP